MTLRGSYTNYDAAHHFDFLDTLLDNKPVCSCLMLSSQPGKREEWMIESPLDFPESLAVHRVSPQLG